MAFGVLFLLAANARAADKTIDDFTTLTSAATGDELLIYDISASSPRTRKITVGNLSLAITVTSANITDGTIVNADVNASAALAYSKLALTGAILNADLAGSIANAKLANSAITIAGTSTSLGSAITASAILDSISSTRGSILYRGASGWAALAPGTSGTFLKSNGSGADPSYASAGGGTVTPYNAGNITGGVTLDFANGGFQKAALTGAVTLAVPSSGTEGAALRLWLTASGANRDLDLNASIKRPSDSAITFPKTLTNGKLYSVLLQHNGTDWMLVSLVGGY